jgi:hypothetical protein
MDTFSIQYRFKTTTGREERFRLEIDSLRLEAVDLPMGDLSVWTCLQFHQCPNCPLDPATCTHCPLMTNLVHLMEPFNTIQSHDEIRLEVVTAERSISQRTTAQRGISSLMGLLIAVSGCPHTVYFKPMARFHLPLAGEEETLYRAASMYLLGQYLRRKNGWTAEIDLAGLKQIYLNMQKVNTAVAGRLREATKTDSSANALILLDMYAKTVPYVIEESLDELRYLFEPYLTD